MPSVEHTKSVAAPFAIVWPFVRDMDNWAPLVTGYQSHTRLNDKESVWLLKGELGGLTRTAEFKVVIGEWDESGRVTFSLEGLSEPVAGSGIFVANRITEADAVAAPRETPTLSARLAAARDAFARLILRFIFRGRRTASSARASDTREATELAFSLTVTAGGMAGVALNMLIAPMLKPVAEDLADGIASAITSNAS